MTTAIREKGEQARTKELNYEVLTRVHEPPCISIYVEGDSAAGPAERTFRRFKEAVRNAGTASQDTLRWGEEADKLVEANRQLIEEVESAIRADKTGAAIFISKDSSDYYRLPASAAGRVVVGSEFFIRPLLPLISTDDRFFLLALSQNHVRLFEATRRGIQERQLLKTPENLHADLAEFSFERNYEMHTAASPGSGQKGAIFHGPSLKNKDRLIHFFRDIDHGVAGVLKGEQAPLIVASVDYLFPIYREANTYPHLLEEAVIGNPDLLSPNALRDASWEIAEKAFAGAPVRAFDVYKQHINTPLTSSNLRKIVAAAYRGTVRFLFVPAIGERWGFFESPATVHVHENREATDEELVNLAAVLTLRHGGNVYPVAPGDLPQGAGMAAVFRF